MSDLTTADVETFTAGRLADGDDQVQEMLDAAVVRARHHVGWHVSPQRSESIVLDGPGTLALQLPTRRLVALTAVTENGAVVDLAKLDWSELGKVRKVSGANWSGRYRAITATITHGYTEAEAADWRRAILSMVDQMSRVQQSGCGDLIRKRVDDVEYQWADYGALADRALYSVGSTLDAYMIDPVYLA